jgi:hypothetical protein
MMLKSAPLGEQLEFYFLRLELKLLGNRKCIELSLFCLRSTSLALESVLSSTFLALDQALVSSTLIFIFLTQGSSLFVFLSSGIFFHPAFLSAINPSKVKCTASVETSRFASCLEALCPLGRLAWLHVLEWPHQDR